MVNYAEGEFASLLGPNFRQDPEVQALSYAVKQSMQVLLSHAQKANVYAGIENITEDVADMLAEELQAPGYEFAGTFAKKLKILQNALPERHLSGTNRAVEDLLRMLFGDSVNLETWDKYSGEPFHFRFYVNENHPVDTDFLAYLAEIIKSVSNARSRPDGIMSMRGINVDSNMSIIHNRVKVNPVYAEWVEIFEEEIVQEDANT